MIVPVLIEGYRCPNGYVKGGGSLDLHFLDPIRPQEYTTAEGLRDHVRSEMRGMLRKLQDSTRDVSLLNTMMAREKVTMVDNDEKSGKHVVDPDTGKGSVKRNSNPSRSHESPEDLGKSGSGGAVAAAAAAKGWFDDLVAF